MKPEDIIEEDKVYEGVAVERKVGEQEFVDKLRAREEAQGVTLEIVPDEQRGDVKFPLRVMYEQEKVECGRLPLWYLQALGSMTPTEYNQFVKGAYGQLNINEIAAADLIQGVINKEPGAVARFWDIQKTLLKSKNITQQINNITITQDTAVRNMMDDISDGLFGKSKNSSQSQGD